MSSKTRTPSTGLVSFVYNPLWETVRETFDYPVFVAAPAAVGITSTGETGEDVPNDLPAVLDAWRTFEAWKDAGADPEDMPDFPLPSAA